jgi:hypothetical protein
MHNHPIMASSSSASNWVCGACALSNKGGKYCTMCATPCLMRKVVLAELAADFPLPAAAFAAPTEVAKVMAKTFFSAPMPGAVVDMPEAVAAVPAAVVKIAGAFLGAPAPVAKIAKAPVVKKAKVAKESAPVMADVAMPAPVPVTKANAPKKNVPGPFHLSGVVVEIVGTEMGDRGCSCEEHPNNCDKVLASNMVVHLRKVQIVVERLQETAIVAYWVSDSIDHCHVGVLPCHMVKHAVRYDGALAQVTHVFSEDPTCSNSAERRMFHKNKGCCLVAIIAWRSGYTD